METVQLDDVARRGQRYWDVDGLPELMMGVLWMLWGGAWLFGQTLPHEGIGRLFWAIVPVLLTGSGVAALWATKRLKMRLTFPRTGYVDWKAPSRSANLAAIVIAAGLAGVIVAARGRLEQGATPMIGVILGLAFVVASLRQRAPHLLALAGVAVALGLALGGRAEGWESTNWLFVALGLVSAVMGAVRLARFLRQNPRVPLEEA